MFSVATVQEEKKKKEWYLKLLADLKAILAREERARIQFKHEIGRRILQEKGYIEYGDIFDFMVQLGQDLNYSWRELYYCVQFAQRYPNLEDFFNESTKVLPPVAKLPTWKEIRDIVLPKGMETLREEAKPQEPKLCELEEYLTDLLRVVTVKKDQMLNCDTCEMKEECATIKPKLLLFGEKYFGD